jgi:FkbM family methyltransferase
MQGPKIKAARARYRKNGGGENKNIVFECLRRAAPLGRVLHIGAHQAEEWPIYSAMSDQPTTWVEASKDAATHVRKVLDANGRKSDAVIHGAAWSEGGKTFEMSHLRRTGPTYSGRSTLYELRAQMSGELQEPCAKEDVESLALDEVLGPGYQTIVLDIQGAELEALKGMPKIIDAAKHIVVETCWVNIAGGPAQMQGIIDLLWSHGYYMMYYSGYSGHRPIGDALFLRGDLPEDYQIAAE